MTRRDTTGAEAIPAWPERVVSEDESVRIAARSSARARSGSVSNRSWSTPGHTVSDTWSLSCASRSSSLRRAPGRWRRSPSGWAGGVLRAHAEHLLGSAAVPPVRLLSNSLSSLSSAPPVARAGSDDPALGTFVTRGGTRTRVSWSRTVCVGSAPKLDGSQEAPGVAGELLFARRRAEPIHRPGERAGPAPARRGPHAAHGVAILSRQARGHFGAALQRGSEQAAV